MIRAPSTLMMPTGSDFPQGTTNKKLKRPQPLALKPLTYPSFGLRARPRTKFGALAGASKTS
jgi:hypothetical protein